MSKIALITGSVRTPRVGPHVARWVSQVLDARPLDSLHLEPLSIASFNLPVFDEPVSPAMVPAYAQFTKDHSKKWSAAIAAFDGYVFVIPEYNAGMAGGTKNAIDYLYSEWPGKPVVIISYGLLGGSRANEQLAFTLEKVMKLQVIPTRVELPFKGGSGAPDSIQAATTGTLGEDSVNGWVESGKKEEILKAWSELKAALGGTADEK